IIPYVEKHYHVLTDRPDRAMAGLSMGGAQTLGIAISHLDKFAYLGVFSSGIFGGASGSWESERLKTLDDAALKEGLKLLWFGTGSEDFVLSATKETLDVLKKHGFHAVYKESTGGHTWTNWRNYLNEFAPQLFQEAGH